LHGIERTRNMQGSPESDRGIVRIVVRYSDGRTVNFVPDAQREVFSEDDILELKKVFSTASAVAEWAEVTARSNGE
jgi:hypothetical protein